jgi:hypothetical protein
MFMSYMVKGVSKDLKAYDGFTYPWRGPVEAKDWSKDYKCGGGLHGIDRDRCYYPITNDVYLVIEYDPMDGIIDLKGKIKIRKGKVVYLSKSIRHIEDWLRRHGEDWLSLLRID